MAKSNFIYSNKILKNRDSEEVIANENPINYKGIFYGDDTEQMYYEGGAHFQYKDICKRLNNVLLVINQTNKEDNKQSITRKNVDSNDVNTQIKESSQSRNKNPIAGSNTLKTAQFTRNIQLAQTNGIAKPSMLNNHLYTNQTNNGGENNLIPGLTKYRNEKLFTKQIEFHSKLPETKNNEEKEEKNLLLNNLKFKNSQDNFEIKSSAPSKTKVANNYFFMKIDPINKVK